MLKKICFFFFDFEVKNKNIGTVNNDKNKNWVIKIKSGISAEKNKEDVFKKKIRLEFIFIKKFGWQYKVHPVFELFIQLSNIKYNFIINNKTTFNTYSIFLQNKCHLSFFCKLLFFFKFNDRFALNDLFCYSNFHLVFNFSSILRHFRYIVFLTLNSFYSLSGKFKSSIWLERELYEFHKVKILKQKDKRYLLLDYSYKDFNKEKSSICYFDYMQNVIVRKFF